MGRQPQMTLQTLAVLHVLLRQPAVEHYGLEIANEAALPTGSIYPILARLEHAGWLTSAWEEIDPVAQGRPPRRYYRLSSAGAERARKELARAQRSFSVNEELPIPHPQPGTASP
jgi:PadR family transcriptional regulator PadR